MIRTPSKTESTILNCLSGDIETEPENICIMLKTILHLKQEIHLDLFMVTTLWLRLENKMESV